MHILSSLGSLGWKPTPASFANDFHAFVRHASSYTKYPRSTSDNAISVGYMSLFTPYITQKLNSLITNFQWTSRVMVLIQRHWTLTRKLYQVRYNVDTRNLIFFAMFWQNEDLRLWMRHSREYIVVSKWLIILSKKYKLT